MGGKASPLLQGRGYAHRKGVPVIYVNHNFSKGSSDFDEIFSHCIRREARARKVCQALKPTAGECEILKPRHSAFFYTPLLPLFKHLDVHQEILAGIATNLCVLFTAHDAHMEEIPVTVLSDCCAAESDFDHDTALSQLENFCEAKICNSSELKLVYVTGEVKPN